eukprot:Gb_04622 [translate_table: standard]
MGFQLQRSLEAMESTQGVIAALMVVLLASILFLIIRRRTSAQKNLPPGPRGYPIIGNLLMLGKLPHRALGALSEKYGPLMFLRLGSVPTVVVSSPDMAKEVLKTHDLVFASRPTTSGSKYMLYNASDIALTPYGHYWRQVRKVCVLQLLSAKRIESFRFVREEEVNLMIQSILEHTVKYRSKIPVNVSKTVSGLSMDIICRMAFGRKYSSEAFDNRGFNAVIREFLYLLGAFDIGDFIPWLAWMDLQGLNRRQKNVHKTLDAFMEKIIEEHVAQSNDGLQRDFVDVLLAISEEDDMEIKLTRDNIKANLLEMLLAGTDTSSNVVEWAMSELLRNPSKMKKLQEELECVVGLNRKVQESDLSHLEYLEAVVKETMRLHPPAPLLIPHESMEDCTISSYEIPYKTRVIINDWVISRDPKSWDNVEIFNPERFIGSFIDMRGKNFELIPFGSGRRGCPGMQLGIIVLKLTLAQLLHCFDWRLPNGMKFYDLDMSEEFGFTMPRASHLLAIPTPRTPIL